LPTATPISNYIVLHPRTAIVAYDMIPWRIQVTVGGAISSMLYGDDKDRRKSFYGSPVDRTNKKVLEEFASQVYSYVNSSISEYADTDDYRFRVWTEVKVNQKTGEILDQPVFNVDIYRYVARVSARAVETKDFALQVTFVGNKDDIFITPFVMRSLKQAKSATKYLDIEMYMDRSSSPANIKKKLVQSFPTLIVADHGFPVKSKTSPDGTVIPYIEDDKKQFDLIDESALMRFIAEKSGLKPEILGFDTGFQRVDEEVQKIAKSVRESTTLGTTPTTERDLLASLGLDAAFKALTTQLEKAGDWKADDAERTLKKFHGELEEKRKQYTALKTEYVTEIQHMEHLITENNKNRLDFDTFDAARVKSLFNKNGIEEQLVELQELVKGELTQSIAKYVETATKPSTKEP
jgi:hypothetical protein